MEGVSNFPSTFVDTNPDYSSKHLDSLITQGHVLNSLQLVNKDVFQAGKDAQIEAIRQAADILKEVAHTREMARIEALQTKQELSDKVKEDGEKTRDLIRACKMDDQAAEIAFLKAQVLNLSPTP